MVNLQCNTFLIKKHLKCSFSCHYKNITCFDQEFNSNIIPVVNPINDEMNLNPPQTDPQTPRDFNPSHKGKDNARNVQKTNSN